MSPRSLALACALFVIGCSADDVATPDGGGDGDLDGTVSDVDADVSDADADVLVQPDCCAPPPPEAKFQSDEATALCARLEACCAADAGFDFGACVGTIGRLGWESSNADLLVPGVLDGGRLAFSQSSATTCLAGLTTMSCPTVGSAEFRGLTASCTAAVTGVGVVGAACRADSECVTTAYCDLDAGACAALHAQGAPCSSSDQCTYKGGPTPALFCDTAGDASTCQPPRGDDAGCAHDDECASGICDPSRHACATVFSIDVLCAAVAPSDAGSD